MDVCVCRFVNRKFERLFGLAQIYFHLVLRMSDYAWMTNFCCHVLLDGLLTNQIALLLPVRGWTEFGKMFRIDCRWFLFSPPPPPACDSRLHNYPWMTIKHSVNIRQQGKNSPIIPPSPPVAYAPHLSSCWPNSLSILTSSVSWGIFPRRSQSIKIDVGNQSISIHSLGLWLEDFDINR